ncbi:ABC transporter permease [Gordonia sp. HY002]|uniref:ABC transporter permease n=1 Tax=Gordonia zhenghanii TaxID=2911516 RepID=UPI001EEFD6C4|nr:ABC transporter permease [Gordonia zhenghanii]MCF8569210.1 ABC transporter permease [Gordonia zhenghanii]MCF8603558.1 ABC transporter permease [Gordonia zhenghanii]
MALSTQVAGAGPLLRASLRNEVRSFAPWILIPIALSVSSVIVYPLLFPDLSERMSFATTIGSNPALGLIFGPAFDLSTVDGFNAWRSLALGGFAVALGAIFIVVGASRGQEDSGQAELLASGVLGRQSRLLTAVATGVLMSVIAGVATGVVTVLCGGSWGASMVLGAGFTAMGATFAGVAAVTSQIGADARTASSIAVAVLGVLFVLRGFLYSIDAPSWTSWINPLGWVTETRPASGDHWLPLVYAVILAVLLVAVAFALQSSRDFGQGLVAARPGPARGSIRSPFGLAVRLNRSPAISWSIAFIGLGVVFGYFTGSVKDIFASNPALTEVFAAGAASPDDLSSAFVVTILSLAGIIASICGVQTMNRVRAEELDDRAEPVLAAAVSRIGYLRSNVLIALGIPAVCVLVAGAVMGVFVSFADLGLDFGDVIRQALATLPAVWTVVALAVAVIGARPAVRIASWAGVLASFVLTLLGPSFKLPDWALGISPFWHVPDVAVDSSNGLGLIWISLFTLAFLAVGTAGFRRRDTP